MNEVGRNPSMLLGLRPTSFNNYNFDWRLMAIL
jgi:hypothetical protein